MSRDAPAPVRRDVRRVALILGAPHLDNLALVDEIAGKGYTDLGLFVMPPGAGWETEGASPAGARAIARRAEERGLGLVVATCYSKNMKLHLREHPEQRLVLRSARGQRADDRRGCPFNTAYLAQHLAFLEEVAALPALREVWINDEGRLGFTPDDFGCYCDSCREQFRAASHADLPERVDWSSPTWRDFVAWRFDRWTALHHDLADFLRRRRPGVSVAFQTTPLVDLLGTNPWPSAVDLGALATGLDSLSADPYYAATETPFRPRQTYLSHWTRFLRAHAPPGYPTTICLGFSNPAAAYHPREEDGLWNGVAPLAAGADATCWLYYDLFRHGRAAKTYERCFALDPYFARVAPLAHAGVVHGFQSEVWRYAEGVAGGNYDWTAIVPLAEILREGGVPFGYVADARLEPDALAGQRVLVLPWLACLSVGQRDALRAHAAAGGGVVACGELDVADERGRDTPEACLAGELFGVGGFRPLAGSGPAAGPAGNAETDPTRLSPFAPAAAGLVGVRVRTPDHPLFAGYDPARDPELRLGRCLAVEGVRDEDVLAWFLDGDGQQTRFPAIVATEQTGSRRVYFAGMPTVGSYALPERAFAVPNPAPRVFRNAAEWAAGRPAVLRLEGFPPLTAYRRARPEDVRAITTVEFLPLVGEDLALACFASYAFEQYDFGLAGSVPEGRRVGRVRELLSGEDVPYALEGQTVRLEVRLTPRDAVKVIAIEWSRQVPRERGGR